MDADTFRAIAAQHGAQIVDDFLHGDLHAECACGWVGDPSESHTDALAEHAAHVHVALGLATAGGEETGNG